MLNQVFSFTKTKHEEYLDPLIGGITEQYYAQLGSEDDAAGFGSILGVMK